jgi:hypothetical protein
MNKMKNYFLLALLLSALCVGSCQKSPEQNRISGTTSKSGFQAAVNNACNGPVNLQSNSLQHSIVVISGDSMLWLRGQNSAGNVELGVYIPWPVVTGFQSDYEVYYDATYESGNPANTDDRLKSSYFSIVPTGVDVTLFENAQGGTGVGKISVEINDVQVYKVDPMGGPGLLQCVDQGLFEIE